jgi:hypothetical protein
MSWVGAYLLLFIPSFQYLAWPCVPEPQVASSWQRYVRGQNPLLARGLVDVCVIDNSQPSSCKGIQQLSHSLSQYLKPDLC